MVSAAVELVCPSVMNLGSYTLDENIDSLPSVQFNVGCTNGCAVGLGQNADQSCCYYRDNTRLH